jgi:hypothetical protein
MRRAMRTMVLAGILAVGTALGLATSPAKAQGFGGYPGGYGGGYGASYGSGYGGGYGGYNNPGFSYYGNGGHDFQPHWHTTQTPIGSIGWYGNGAHDFQPHVHTQTPFGITGYSGGLFQQTQSYSPPTPYTFMPW